MSQLVFSRCWNPEYVSSNAKLRNGLASKSEVSRQRKKKYHSSVFCLRKVWTRLKNVPSHLKRSRVKAILPTLNVFIKKIPSQMYPSSWIVVNSRCSQADAKNSHHTFYGKIQPDIGTPMILALFGRQRRIMSLTPVWATKQDSIASQLSRKAGGWIGRKEFGMVARTCNSSIWKAYAGGSGVQGCT